MSNAKIWEINDDFEKFNEFYRSIYKAHQRGMPSPPASLGASGSGSVFLLSCPRCQLVLGSLERGLPCLWIVCRCVRSEWSDLLALGWLRCACHLFITKRLVFPFLQHQQIANKPRRYCGNANTVCDILTNYHSSKLHFNLKTMLMRPSRVSNIGADRNIS